MNTQSGGSARPRSLPLLTLLLALGGGTALSAQQTDTGPAKADVGRSGVHFALALGSASVGASCADCQIDVFSDRMNGFSGTIQLGGALTPKLIVAAEFMGWVRNDVPIYRRIAGLSLVFIGFPSERSGFFIRGGGGALRAIVEDDNFIVQADAFTSQIGVGYDVPMSGRMKLTPQVTYISTFGGATTLNGVTSPVVVSPNLLQIGIGLSVH